jgi:hypothetical protein
MANVTPLDVGGVSGHTRILIDAVKENIADLKMDVKDIKSHRFSDLLWHITGLVGVAVVLGSMLIAAYFRLDDKISSLSTQSTRIETKLDDIIARIPPAPLKTK